MYYPYTPPLMLMALLELVNTVLFRIDISRSESALLPLMACRPGLD